MENYVIYVIDTETTGLVPGVNEIIELSAFRIFLDEESKSEQKTWLIRAMHPENINQEALNINGHKREDILHLTKNGKSNYIYPEKALEEIESWIDEDGQSAMDRVFAGQNPIFDYDHMYEMWKKYDVQDTFPFVTGPNKLIIDTKMIALFIDVLLGKKRERYNLTSLVNAYKVKKGNAHRADEDTRMTKDLLLLQVKGMKEGISHFKDLKF